MKNIESKLRRLNLDLGDSKQLVIDLEARAADTINRMEDL